MSFFADVNTVYGILAVVFVLAVAFLNGFTDAPNAIATAVFSKALTMSSACVLCAVFNALGFFASSVLGMGVARAVFSIAEVGENREVAVFASLLSVFIFTVCAWLLSMPSSESHALISALVGAGLAMGTDASLTPLFKIALYMIFSCVISLLLTAIAFVCLKKAFLPYKRLQIASCAIMSASHGAQDGQKLLGILLLLLPSTDASGNTSMLFAVCVPLFLGTLLGGGKIVKTLGKDIGALNEKSAFIADLGAGVSLFVCSFLGVPVSTSNVKAGAIALSLHLGGKKVNSAPLVKMAYVALATMPLCAALSYFITRLILN